MHPFCHLPRHSAFRQIQRLTEQACLGEMTTQPREETVKTRELYHFLEDFGRGTISGTKFQRALFRTDRKGTPNRLAVNFSVGYKGSRLSSFALGVRI